MKTKEEAPSSRSRPRGVGSFFRKAADHHVKEDAMSTRGTAVILGLTLVGAACGGGEGRIVDQYFGAVNAGDNQTVASFAMVTFKDKVERWSVTTASPETRSPAALAGLVEKGKQLEAAVAANKKEAAAYQLTNAADYNRYVEVKDKTKVPGSLQKFAADWTKFEQADKDFRRQISESKAAVERERKNAQLSVGQVEGLDSMTGEMAEKKLDLALTVKGEVKNYTMVLRKYDLTGDTGGRGGRWVVQSLQPK